VGETFTLVARVEDVDDLYGMSLKVKWNTIYLDYVTHVAKVPVESFSDGLLHEQVVFVYDDVNTTTGLYALAVTSLSPAIGFTGSGIAFEITFRVKYQPLRPEQDVIFSGFFFGVINLVSSGCFIPHIIEDCEVTIASFLQADFNNDLIIDIYDIVIGVDAYGSTPIDPNWNDDCDLAEPYGIIDILDIVTIASHFGEEYKP
jgi:hypothetical protein